MHNKLAGDNIMKIDIPARPPKEAEFPTYINWFMSNILIPYPLYIITTVDGNGIPNAQPNTWGLPYGSGNLNMFLFSSWTRHHTPQNVLETKEFVINIPSRDIVKQVMKTVESFPRGVDEIKASGLKAIPSKIVKTPRIAECQAHLECRYLWSHTAKISDEVTDIVIAGEIVAASADEEVLYCRAKEKIAAMRIPYLTNRNIDARNWKVKDPQMCGIITQLKDFWKMTR